MKKTLYTLFLTVIATLFLGCNLVTIQDQELADPPSANPTSGGIGLSVYRYSSDTKYINIYRKDVTSSSDEEAPAINIGIIFPNAYSSSDKSYFLEDYWLYSGHKYKYMVRYCEPEKYYSSDWTDEITATYGYDSSAILSYQTGGVKFRFSESDLTLKILGNIANPDINNFAEEWTPVIAVKCEEATQVFNLESIANDTYINLRGLLSTTFYNTDITILGIAGQKAFYTTPTDGSDPKLKQLIWTEPSFIEIQGYSGNILYIQSESTTSGYDFS